MELVVRKDYSLMTLVRNEAKTRKVIELRKESIFVTNLSNALLQPFSRAFNSIAIIHTQRILFITHTRRDCQEQTAELGST